jgi:hypothetical protein
MRRISTITKEAFCWSRAQITLSQERLEHWENHSTPEGYLDLLELSQSLEEGFADTLSKLVALEIKEVADEFNLSPNHCSKVRSAFPYLQGTEIELEESIIEYAAEIVEDVTEMRTVSALQIADEFEEWLNDLYEWHYDNQRLDN